MTSAVTFYPWNNKNVHIIELIELKLISEKKGTLEFIGYFSPIKIPMNIIFIRSGEKALYISVTDFVKNDSKANSRIATFVLYFELITIIESSVELKRISRCLIDEGQGQGQGKGQGQGQGQEQRQN
jgi:hypothetical protein